MNDAEKARAEKAWEEAVASIRCAQTKAAEYLMGRLVDPGALTTIHKGDLAVENDALANLSRSVAQIADAMQELLREITALKRRVKRLEDKSK